MTIKKSILSLFVLACLALPLQALAYPQACVSLLFGAGYAAEMRITTPSGFNTDWSGSFPVGQTRCQSLAALANGAVFSVQVHAIAGNTKTCTPENLTQVSSPVSVTYNAWGTTLNVSCEMPAEKAAELKAGDEAKQDVPK